MFFPCCTRFFLLRKSYFELSQKMLKNINYFKIYLKFKKALNFCFFGNVFVNNGLNHVILRGKSIVRYFIN